MQTGKYTYLKIHREEKMVRRRKKRTPMSACSGRISAIVMLVITLGMLALPCNACSLLAAAQSKFSSSC